MYEMYLNFIAIRKIIKAKHRLFLMSIIIGNMLLFIVGVD